jgi:hypothetical protein
MDKQAPEKVIPSYSHPVNRVLNSRKPVMVLLKYVLVSIVVVMGFLNFKFATRSLISPSVYKKDFIQEYLLARAVLNDVDPYLPLPELSKRFLKPLPNLVFQHPTPHPPPVSIVALPFGLIGYEQAAAVWFLFEVICIVLSIYLILRCFDVRPKPVRIIFFSLLILNWSPFRYDLVVGQLMTLLLVFLIGAWQALRSGKDIKGGVFLGCLISLKLIAWPVVIFLSIRRNWAAVIATGVTVVTANLGAGLMMGLDRVAYYYFKVSIIVSPLYHAYESNFSMWTIGWRMFEGTGSPVLLGLEAPPLVAAPAVAHLVSLAIPMVLLALSLTLALRAHSFDTSFGILVCVSILVNPVAWSHYLILISIPLSIVARRLLTLDLLGKETWWLLFLGLLLSIPRLGIRRIILQVTGNELTANSVQVSFSAALLTYIPALAVLGLLWLVWQTERVVYPDHR